MEKMKGSKFVAVFLGICVFFAIVFLVILKNAFDTRPQLAIPDPSAKRYDPRIYDIKDKLNEPTESRIDLLKEAVKSVTAAEAEEKCLVTISEALKFPLDHEPTAFISAVRTDPCYSDATFNAGRFNRQTLLATCEKDITSPDCKAGIVFFKANLLDRLTADTQLHNLTEQQLMLKFLNALFGQSESDIIKGVSRRRDLAAEMMRRNPEDPRYQDAFLQAEVTPILNGDAQAQLSPQFNELLMAKLQERPYDERLQEYLFVRDINQPLEERKAQAEKVFAANPDSSIAAYFISGFHYKAQDFENAKKWLEKAVLLNPNSQRYKETLVKLNDGAQSENIYTVMLTWGFSSN